MQTYEFKLREEYITNCSCLSFSLASLDFDSSVMPLIKRNFVDKDLFHLLPYYSHKMVLLSSNFVSYFMVSINLLAFAVHIKHIALGRGLRFKMDFLVIHFQTSYRLVISFNPRCKLLIFLDH